MRNLENRLIWLKLTINSYYIDNKKDSSQVRDGLGEMYEETFILKKKIKRIKNRKSKIKNILNGR